MRAMSLCPFLPLRATLGMTPSEGKEPYVSMSPGVRIELSKFSTMNAKATPLSRPPIKPKAIFNGTFGSTGSPGTLARSTILMLLDFRPARIPASFSF